MYLNVSFLTNKKEATNVSEYVLVLKLKKSSQTFIKKISTFSCMLDKKEFSQIREEMHKLDVKREEVIQTSREIINISKQVIYAVQRNEMKDADSAVKNIKSKVKKLRKIKILTDTNINSVAFQ